MFTSLTKTTRTIQVVLVVAVLTFLVPVIFVFAQDGSGQTPANGYVPFQSEPASGLNPSTGYVEFTSTNAQASETGASTGSGGNTSGVVASTVTPNDQDPELIFADSKLTLMLYNLVVTFFGFLVFAGGYLLDFAVNHFVINFGLEFNTSGVGVAVNDLWSLVRDFFNILFIFGFIWIGFQMILDSGNSRAKQTLVSLIMAALLVNFSLFISKFVVDFSNRLASEVALEAFPRTEASSAETFWGTSGSDQIGISDTFFAHLGVSKTLRIPKAIAEDGAEPWAFIFGSAIFYLVAAFVFAAGGVMLIIRFVALSIFMVLSPFMFLGWVFPGLQGWTGKYWKGFLGRAFYAPVYIVLLFFAASILQNMFGTNGSSEVIVDGQPAGLLSAVTNNENNLIEVLGPFVLSAAFMLAAVIVAGKMSADGAGGVMRVGNSLRSGGRRLVGGATLGVGARVGRNTIGRGASAAVNNEKFKAYAGRSVIGRQLFKGAQTTAGASFDARQVGKVGKSLGIGEGTKGGFAKQAKDRAKAEDKFAKDIAASVDFDDPKTQYDLQQKTEQVRSNKQTEIDKLNIKREEEKLQRQGDPKWQKKQMDIGEKMDDITHDIEQNGGVATEQQQAELAQLQMELEKDEFLINKEIANLEKEKIGAEKIAKGEMKFGNEIEYAKQLKRSEKFWKSLGTVAGSAGVGLAAGAGALAFTATAPLSVPIGLAAALASKVGSPGNAQLAKAGYKEIENRVGKDGTKGLKNDQRSKDAKAVQKFLSEQGGDDSNKEDAKDKDKDS